MLVLMSGRAFLFIKRRRINMKPSFEEVKELKGFSVIPVSVEIMSDIKTPIQVLKNHQLSIYKNQSALLPSLNYTIFQ